MTNAVPSHRNQIGVILGHAGTIDGGEVGDEVGVEQPADLTGAEETRSGGDPVGPARRVAALVVQPDRHTSHWPWRISVRPLISLASRHAWIRSGTSTM